jgi:hypothetical protein
MSTLIAQVTATNYINNAEFIRVTIPDDPNSPYTFSNSYKIETFSGGDFVGTYTNLGGLLAVSGHQRDLAVTSFDTTISLIGIDQTKIGLIIDAGLKGSKIEIWRGFYDTTYNLTSDPVLRYTGIVTSYVIDEQLQDRVNSFVLNLHCSSYKRVLENRIAGRNTTAASWKQFNPTDISMDRVASLNNAKFNFGQKLA